MTMTTRIIILIFCSFVIVNCCITTVMSTPTTYDQRQSGDLNVQIELKDIRVIALVNSELLEDYTDYDYFYDYADFTIKPSNKSTTSATTRITEGNDITNIVESTLSQNLVISASSNNITNSISSNEETQNINQSNGTTKGTANSTSNIDDNNDKSQLHEENKSVTYVSTSSTITPSNTMKQGIQSRKHCKSGYVPNGNRRCRRVHRRWQSLLP